MFENNPIILKSDTKNEELFIENPNHVQMNHVENLRNDLFNTNYIHPSTGDSALHTSWVMDKILGKI